ncbi:RDD family protein [Bradyrhizobium sp. HKCCYLS1011]|uniref:RDD family protein n=1 Tax=Bradyrhizobium sp. HKCCYLS1011 TaxID=3420733 RepID=UPI003EB8A1D6
MTDPSLSSNFKRAGVWRRLAALLIDVMIIAVILQLCALVLFPLTHGRIQFADGIYAINCSKLDSLPAGVAIPADFNANVIIDCQNSVLGLLSARTLRVQRVTRDGAITKEIHIDSMLDADGVPIVGLSLGILLLPLLLVWRFALDDRQGTPGRRICRTRLVRADDGSVPSASEVRRRYLFLLAILGPLIIWPVILSFFPVTALPENVLIAITLASYGPALIVGLAAWRQVYVRSDTWYDRFAGTSVIRAERSTIQLESASFSTAPAMDRFAEAGPAVLFGDAGQTAPPEGTPISAASPPPLPPPADQGKRSYIARHWRGELSLPLSYWVNGGLVGVIAGATIAVIAGLIVHEQFDAEPVPALLWMSAIWLCVALLTLWQLVGIWRSATRYRAAGKGRWGLVAKVMVALGAASTLLQFFMQGLPQIAGVAEIVAGDRSLGPHQFKVLAYGEMLEFSGGIKFGVAKELEDFLSAMPELKTVRLDSVGGRIREAQKMSDLIKAHGLSTLVEKQCLSACTIVFLGGKDRAILSSAKLGFHQPTYRGITAAERSRSVAAEEERLQKLGLSRAFAERANKAEPSSMWFPEGSELLREHVVTRIVPAQTRAPAKLMSDAPISSSNGAATQGNEPVAAPASPQAAVVTLPRDLVQRLQSSKPANRVPSSITGQK